MLPEVNPQPETQPQTNNATPANRAWYDISPTGFLSLLGLIILVSILSQVAVDLRWPDRLAGFIKPNAVQPVQTVFETEESDEFNPGPLSKSDDIEPPPVNTGPGQFACDPTGTCNHYADPSIMGCPRTYADHACLQECGDTAKQCQQ